MSHKYSPPHKFLFGLALLTLLMGTGAAFGKNALRTLNYPYKLLNKGKLDSTNAAILDDFDNDGDLDIVITNQPNIAWLENNGTGQFPKHILFTEGTNFRPQDIDICDCDNDGDTDYVIASGRGSGGNPPGQLLWLQRQADGSFIQWTIKAGADFDRADVADFNNDGLPDIVAVGFSQNSVSIYLNDGFLNFAEQVIAENVVQVDLVKADDIDGDGDVDVVFGGSTNSMLLRNLGNAVFDEGQPLYTWSDSHDSFNSGLAIVDLDGDGFKDILTFSGAGTGGLYFLDGADNFNQSLIERDGIDLGGDILVADIDGNGRKDIVRQNIHDDYLSVLYQNSEMVFTRVIVEHNWDNRAPSQMALGDMDADSDVDLVFPENGNVDEDLSWYENVGGQFYGHYLYMQLSNLYMTKLADLDGDGDLDVLATTGENIVPENELLWFENRGAAGFVNWRLDDQVRATNLAITDVDGNGSLDVVVSASADNSLFWYRKNGLDWEKNVIEANGNLPFAIAAADLDSDGDVDVALTSQGDDKVFWYMNDGSGNFVRRVVDPNLSFPRQIEAADLDDDGDVDLAVAVPNASNSVVIYLNDGSEVFTRETVLTGYIAADLEIGDWNGDGRPDILAGFGGNPDSYVDVALLQNDGLANFTVSPLVTDYGSTVSLKLVDADSDNDLDLILGKISPVDNGFCGFDPTCYPIPALKIILNDNGTTSSQDLLDAINANITIWGIDAGDVDQDGVMDVVAAENIQGNLYLFKGEPSVEPPPMSTVINPSGGVFAPTDSITFTFPAGAFTEPVTVTFAALAPIPHMLPDVGVFYELTAVSTATNQPTQLEPGQTFTAVVPYDEANLPVNVSEGSLKLFNQTGGLAVQQPNMTTATWEAASSNVVDAVGNTVTAVDGRLGTWAIFGAEDNVEPPSNSSVINPSGGVFTPTGSITFTFPAGAFAEPVTVTFATLVPIPHTLPDVGMFYELTAVSTATNQPVQLDPGQTFTAVVQYDEANLPPGVGEDSLGLYYAVSSPAQQPNNVTTTWNPASSNAVNTETNEITAVDSHLGTWAVFGAGAGYELFLPAVIKP